MLRLLDGELGEAELEALEAEIQRNPEALRAWQTLSKIHSELELLHQSEVLVRANPVVPVKRILARQRRRFVRASFMAAAALLLISGLVLWMYAAPGKGSFKVGFQIAPHSSFSLADRNGNPLSEDQLAVGSELRLYHGAAELLLPNQVRALVEAPASLRILDEQTLQMDCGRAFFRVGSAEGRGFTVVTPSQRIVDLGTAFGIGVQKGGETALHVFEGSVRVDGMDGEMGEVLASGRSVRLEGLEIAGDIEGAPPIFLRELPEKVETVFVEDFESGLVFGRDYTVQVDPQAILDLEGNPFPGIADQATWNFRAASPGIPVSVASYAYDGSAREKPSGHIPSTMQASPFLDTGNTKLTDGDPGGAGGWSSGGFVGFNQKPVRAGGQVTFDLGSVHEIQEIAFTTHHLGSGRLGAVRVSSSRDGVAFSTPVRVVPVFSGLDAVTGTIDPMQLGPARFFRLNFESAHEWIFLGEVKFTAPAPASPLEIPPPNPAANPGLGALPPALLAVFPADGAQDTPPGGALTMVFSEPVRFGRGRIILRNMTDWSEQEIVVGGSRTSAEGRVVTVLPRLDLPDGAMQASHAAGWHSAGRALLMNPDSSGRWYSDKNFGDSLRGEAGAMKGRTILSMGPQHQGSGISREFTSIVSGNRYSVSVAVGVRVNDAEQGGEFLGYRIRLRCGEVVLAETISESPPGPPDTFTNVGLFWDSSTMPPGVEAGEPLSIEISPANGSTTGYLDIDHVRVSVVKKPGI
jgi:hypothetical protein